tara:strand:- start:14368 stop:15225 length:858 start_codon:yes stop_codon:yes gene_type:complete
VSITKKLNNFLKKYSVKIHNEEPIANGSLKWIPSDRQSNFEKNIKIYPEYLQYYVDNPIIYKINKQYFRSTFDFKPDKNKKVNLFLGCSNTFGIGLHWEHTWPYLLSEKLDSEIINLGVPGGCMELSYLNLKKYIDFFDVQNIFHLQDIYARYLGFMYSKLDSFSITSPDIFKKVLFLFYTKEQVKSVFSDPDYMVYSHLKSLDAIKFLCIQKDVPYFYNHITPDFELPWQIRKKYGIIPTLSHDKFLNDFLSRDLAHPHLSTTKEIANEFFNIYTKYPKGHSTL